VVLLLDPRGDRAPLEDPLGSRASRLEPVHAAAQLAALNHFLKGVDAPRRPLCELLGVQVGGGRRGFARELRAWLTCATPHARSLGPQASRHGLRPRRRTSTMAKRTRPSVLSSGASMSRWPITAPVISSVGMRGPVVSGPFLAGRSA